MTFREEIEIERGIDQVWDAFVDRALAGRWQSTLRSVEPIAGCAGEPGAVARMTYREAGRDVVVDETVVESVRPTAMVCTLTSSMMTSTMANRFSSSGTGATRWVVECEIRFRGLWKLMGLLGRRMIVRKTVADMERFKQMVESQTGDGPDRNRS
jgi:uncharacterized protein YndB with AHSA1/START domain